MSTTAVRKHPRSLPILAMVAIEAVALVATILIMLRVTGVSFHGAQEGPTSAATDTTQVSPPEWEFVLRTPGVVSILRDRPGLTPLDIIRTHAFGWEGLTIREVLASPKMIDILRHRPGLTALDLVRIASPVDTGRGDSA